MVNYITEDINTTVEDINATANYITEDMNTSVNKFLSSGSAIDILNAILLLLLFR